MIWHKPKLDTRMLIEDIKNRDLMFMDMVRCDNKVDEQKWGTNTIYRSLLLEIYALVDTIKRVSFLDCLKPEVINEHPTFKIGFTRFFCSLYTVLFINV